MGSRADVQPLSGDTGESFGSENLREGRAMDYLESVNLVDTNVHTEKTPTLNLYLIS